MSEIINRNEEVSQHPEQEGLGKNQPQSNEDIVGNTHDETMTRRQFLRVAAVTAGIAVVANTVPKSIGGQSEEAQNELVGNEYHKPETVHGVEVYGLIDSIKTESQIRVLYEHFDHKFCDDHQINPYIRYGTTKRDLKKEYLPPSERFLEIVVTRSAYNSYIEKISKTEPDFIEWVQTHVAYTNICLANANPPSEMTATLKRIIIIEDNLPNAFYDPNKKDALGGALDWKWQTRFRSGIRDDLPLDMDESWAIAEPAPKEQDKSRLVYLWNYKIEGDEVMFGFPPYETSPTKVYEYPIGSNVFPERLKEGTIDCALPHEWSHYLLNLPDEYEFDHSTNNEHGRPSVGFFTSFSFATGLFVEPRISPYLSMLSTSHIEMRRRAALQDNFEKGYGPGDLPQKINIRMPGPLNNGNFAGQEMRYDVHILKQARSGNKALMQKPDVTVRGSNIRLGGEIRKGKNSKSNLLTIISKERLQVFIPYALFNMSKMAGEEYPVYAIEIIGAGDLGETAETRARESGTETGVGERSAKARETNTKRLSQSLELVDESDIATYIETKKINGIAPYAKMKIAGTTTWGFWFVE